MPPQGAHSPTTGCWQALTSTRALAFGPLSGYLHLQWFSGYGEDILGYNQRRKSQFRVGVAIVP